MGQYPQRENGFVYGKIISYMKKLKKKARKNKSKNIKPKVELGLQYHDLLQ